MSKSKIDQLIEDGIKEIDAEIKKDDDIREFAEYLARNLAQTPVLRVNVANKVYVLSMKMIKLSDGSGRTEILLAAADEIKQKLYGNTYAPALYTAEFNDLYTLEENCQTLLSAFIGHVTGNMKIETLEEDDGIAKVAREKDMK